VFPSLTHHPAWYALVGALATLVASLVAYALGRPPVAALIIGFGAGIGVVLGFVVAE
jgi:putative flippase GtrA